MRCMCTKPEIKDSITEKKEEIFFFILPNFSFKKRGLAYNRIESIPLKEKESMMNFLSHLECGMCGKRLNADRLWNLCPECKKQKVVNTIGAAFREGEGT